MKKNKQYSKYIDMVVEFGISSSKGNAQFYLENLFRNVRLEGKRVLDIGGGSGWISFYVGINTNEEVVCLEPSAGGANLALNCQFTKFKEELDVSNVIQSNTTIEDYHDLGKFDIIILHNSINHLVEGLCTKLRHDIELETKIIKIFKKINKLANRNATMIIVDNSRYHFFQILGFKKNPFCPHVGFHDHETPGYWAKLLAKIGFRNKKVRWHSYSTLRYFGSVIMNNNLSAYILGLPFILEMKNGLGSEPQIQIKIK